MGLLVYLGMKKLLLFFGAMCVAFGAFAQNHYSFSQRSANYTEMTNGTLVLPAEWDEFEVSMAMTFPFKFFGRAVDSITISDDGTYFWQDGDDYLSPHGNDPISRGAGQSPVTYRLDGTGNERILKVQWPNISFYDIADSFPNDFANYQVWYYEGSNIIEFHIGSSFISEGALAEIDLMPFMNDSIGTKGIVLEGDPAQATPNYDLNSAGSLTSNPSVNTIYVFTPGFPNGIAQPSLEARVIMFPIPAKNTLTIKAESSINQIEVYTTNGQLLSTELPTSIEYSLNTSELLPRVYVLRIQTEEGIASKRFIKE